MDGIDKGYIISQDPIKVSELLVYFKINCVKISNYHVNLEIGTHYYVNNYAKNVNNIFFLN